MSDVPERISISPVHNRKRDDDYYLVDRKAFPGKGTEFVRADLHAALTYERDARKQQFETERAWRHRYAATCREFLVDENRCCTGCGGSGYQMYGSTATWRGGVGGQMLTNDVCDMCWGSGDAEKPWPSHPVSLKGPKR